MLLKDYVTTLPTIEKEVIRHVTNSKLSPETLNYYREIRNITEKRFVEELGAIIPDHERVLLGYSHIDWSDLELEFDYVFNVVMKKKKVKIPFLTWAKGCIMLFLLSKVFPKLLAKLTGIPLMFTQNLEDFVNLTRIISLLVEL